MRHAPRLLVGTILLLALVLLNGEPFLYFDTASYLSRPDKAVRLLGEAAGLGQVPPTGAAPAAAAAGEGGAAAGYVVGGRSIFYGAAAWLAAALGAPAAMAALQAALTVGALSVLWDLGPRLPLPGFGAAVLALGLLTPAGFFAGLLTPDAFAPLTIVAVALLLCAWPSLGRAARLFVSALVLFGALSHTSHLLVAAAMTAAGGAALLLPVARGALSARGLAAAAGALVLAVAASWSVDAVAKRLTGLDVIARPHLTAHLVDGGPGAAWVARRCDDAGGPFAVCAYADRLPTDWIAFLFARAPEMGVFAAEDVPPGPRRALSEEDAAFALAVLRADPGGTLAFLAGDALRQVGRVRYDAVPLTGAPLRARAAAFPFGIADGTGGRVASSPAALHLLSDAAEVTAAAGAALLLTGLALLARAPEGAGAHRALLWTGGAVLLGVLLNAAICGALASPYDRFQSRVVPLLPAMALPVWLVLARLPSRARPAAANEGERIPGERFSE